MREHRLMAPTITVTLLYKTSTLSIPLLPAHSTPTPKPNPNVNPDAKPYNTARLRCGVGENSPIIWTSKQTAKLSLTLTFIRIRTPDFIPNLDSTSPPSCLSIYLKPLMCIRTNADHYDLRVNGVKFMDLPDGCRLRQTKREIALKR